jgi:hypothetical protein
MKHVLSTALALLMLSGSAVMVQPDRKEQAETRNDENKKNQNRKASEVRPAPRNQTSRNRDAPAQSIQDENRDQDLRNNPSMRVATPRFSRRPAARPVSADPIRGQRMAAAWPI